MSDGNEIQRGEFAIAGLLLAIGLVVGGWLLGAQIKAVRLGDRYVSVRGLAERTVKSDLAIWPINYTETGDDLPALYAKTEADKAVILKFLAKQGIQPSEIALGIVNVIDTQANPYGGNRRPLYRYIIRQQISVRTARVDQVSAAAQKATGLLQQGILVSQYLTYKFNGLNSVKPDMITEATRNARAAAERFAQDSGSSVGSIRQATQGFFSILPANSGAAPDSEYGRGYAGDADSSMMKTVRVVTDVQYYLGN
ncbi:MAG: SIMPL domain-containing protein [Candidatus Acidiferrales bacterium]